MPEEIDQLFRKGMTYLKLSYLGMISIIVLVICGVTSSLVYLPVILFIIITSIIGTRYHERYEKESLDYIENLWNTKFECNSLLFDLFKEIENDKKGKD